MEDIVTCGGGMGVRGVVRMFGYFRDFLDFFLGRIIFIKTLKHLIILVVADNRREVGELIEDEANVVEEAHSCLLGKKNNVPRKIHLPTIIKTIKTTPRCRDLHAVY